MASEKTQDTVFIFLSPSDISEWVNLGAQRVQAFGKLFMSPVDNVNITQHRGSFCRQHGQQNDHCGTKRRRAD